MDEVEYRLAYNAACNSIDRIECQHTKQAMLLILQMMDGLRQAYEEMQQDEDDC